MNVSELSLGWQWPSKSNAMPWAWHCHEWQCQWHRLVCLKVELMYCFSLENGPQQWWKAAEVSWEAGSRFWKAPKLFGQRENEVAKVQRDWKNKISAWGLRTRPEKAEEAMETKQERIQSKTEGCKAGADTARFSRWCYSRSICPSKVLYL